MNNSNELQLVVHPLYAVPLVEAVVPDAERLNAALRQRILQLESEGEKHRDKVHRDTQYGLFESNFHFHERTEPEVRTLCMFFNRVLRQFIAGMSSLSDEQADALEIQYHTWFHVTRKGGYQGAHNHPNSSWSGIYCVDPGEPGDVGSNSGEVRFHDPRTGSDMYRDPTNDGMRIPYRLGNWQLKHVPGKLIIFPSYLIHEIFPYQGERPRIVVAFNSWHVRR